ncbi:MAG: hypothetical protein JO316_06070 [Abitibacteriaceae bacterium]|nr:hypothetical protein [Abditibacteriaceae bacterium]
MVKFRPDAFQASQGWRGSERMRRLMVAVGLSGLSAAVGSLVLVGCGGGSSSAISSESSSSTSVTRSEVATRDIPGTTATLAQVTRGRVLVTSLGCADCHNRGNDNPSDPHWMAGYLPGTPGQPFQVGPFQTFPANLTPDATTGIGQETDRQIYNALKFGLDPSTTPSVVITTHTPGTDHFPAQPHYLAPPMPWPSFRHLPDADLWAIVAYLKHGIKPVQNKVPDSQFPPDFWAHTYASSKVGPADFPPYPSGNEKFTP